MPEQQKMIVVVADITYNVNEDRHSVSFSNKAKNFNAYKYGETHKNIEEYCKTYKAIIVGSWTEANERIAKMVGANIKNVLGSYGDMLQPKDFTIRWYFTPIAENNEVWFGTPGHCGNNVNPIF